MPSPPAFRVFGFPVQVRSGFLILLVLIILVNPGARGIWLAAFIALFTLLHELGHAFAARATGAEAEIALDFMAGYASFAPTRALSRWERAGISFAGPAAQITVGTLAYIGANGGWGWPHVADDVAIAVLWAGPTIGLFNLIPILPFDGGTILEQFISYFAPQRARRIMFIITVAVVFSTVAFAMTRPALRPYIIFMVMPLLSVAQMATAGKANTARDHAQAELARAEALAWATGDVSRFPAGHVPSPWYRAHQQLTQGHPEIARELVLADLQSHEPLDWWPPDAAPLAALAEVVAELPRPLPVGRPFSSFVLSGVLLRIGEYEAAAHYAAAAYGNGRAPMSAIHVARAAAALGDATTAIGWIRTATAGAPLNVVRIAVASSPEFEPLRHDPALAAVLAHP